MPVRVSTVGEFDALLVNVRDALVAPVAVGVKVTVKGTVCPAVNVWGSVIPERTNSPLSMLAEVTVTEAPLAVSEPFRGELEPTVTVPKASVDGDTTNWPLAVPVPESGILRGEFEASETTDSVPLALPAAVGLKVAVKVTL